MCSLICTISACRKPSTSPLNSERISRANVAIAGLTSVSAVWRRNRLAGTARRCRAYAAGIVGLDQALDMDGKVGDRPVRQHMRDVAERVLVHVEA